MPAYSRQTSKKVYSYSLVEKKNKVKEKKLINKQQRKLMKRRALGQWLRDCKLFRSPTVK